jgi:succinate-semialdehyde dehydrogenase/glutarate-semialdehyde dehydrogenase
MSSSEKSVVESVPKQLLIGGQWRDGSGGQTFGVEDPSTGETLCEVADGTAEDAIAALDAAVEAQAEWAATPANDRSEILHRAFVALGERSDDLAALMTLEMGKAVAESKAEIAYAAEFFRWNAGEALRTEGYYKAAANGSGACWSCASRSGRASSSPPGTSRPRWAPARSARRSPPAARW